MNKKIILWSGLLPVVLLLFSLLMFFVFYNKYQEKTFFYYEQGTDNIIGELRKIPRYSENEKNIKVFADELILGPGEMNLKMIFPEGTKINQLLIREKKLYIDINNMVLQSDIIKSYNIGKSIKLLRKNIEFNFPDIISIIFTINGEEPDIVETD